MKRFSWRAAIAPFRRRRRAADIDRLILRTERAALLRIGALAGRAPIQELFDAISEELARIIDIETGETFQDMAGLSRYDPDGYMTFVSGYGPRPDWPAPIGSRWPLGNDGDGANSVVYRTGRPARIDGAVPVVGPTSQQLTEVLKVRSTVAVPIYVDEVLWGSATVVSPRAKPLPAGTESRMAEFAALVSTSISSAQRRAEVQRLADEHAALRRVATLVASGAEPDLLWNTVVSELGELCHASRTGLVRYNDAMESVDIVALWAADGPHENMLARWPVSGNSLSARLARERAVVRLDNWADVEGEIGEAVRERMSIGSSIMAPVFTEAGLWGGLVLHSPDGEKLTDDIERQVVGFAELVSTAMANADARAEVRRLADEQATIRRVATLVAQQAPLADVCRTAAEGLAALLEVEDVKVGRYAGDDRLLVVGSCGLTDDRSPVGSTLAHTPETTAGQVYRDRRMVRLDGSRARDAGIRSTVGIPVFVGERLWGVLAVASAQPGRLPDRVTQPIADCADLIATAIRNAEAEESLRASRERIVTATDEARRRFERDLHAGAQQRLVALALELRAGQNVGGGDLAATADEVESILTDLRDLSRGLHPAVLSEGGLPAAVRSLARRCPAPVRVAIPDGWTGVDELVEIACYYVVAEALTNVAEHARAGAVDVELSPDDSGVRITVRDDGVGGAATAGGSGLLDITDRVEALGGSLSVSSPPGGGTTLVARLPLARVRADRE